MCITEIWTYHECGCQYLHPIPCHDRFLHSPDKAYKLSENWTTASPSSSSSISSVTSKKTVAEAEEDPFSLFPSQTTTRSDEAGTEATYNHRLHLVRSCSLRCTVQKTFLEPICDDCLLAELGLEPSNDTARAILGQNTADEGSFDGAEWLLESSVEITVEPPKDDDDLSRPLLSFKPQYSSSSEAGSESETPRRGRRRRRALEINRDSLAIDGDSPAFKSRPSSFQKIKRTTTQHLRRTDRKQYDLQSLSGTDADNSDLSTSSASRKRLSWLDHLKSDLGQRVRRKRASTELKEKGQSNQHTEDIPANVTQREEQDHRIPSSHPSIPATPLEPSPSSSSFNPEPRFPEPESNSLTQGTILPLSQTISSSEFDSSFLSDFCPFSPARNPADLEAETEARRKTSNMSSSDIDELVSDNEHHPAAAAAGAGDAAQAEGQGLRLRVKPNPQTDTDFESDGTISQPQNPSLKDPDPGSEDRPSESLCSQSTKSSRSFHTATSTMSMSVEVEDEEEEGKQMQMQIAMHPLSPPS